MQPMLLPTFVENGRLQTVGEAAHRPSGVELHRSPSARLVHLLLRPVAPMSTEEEIKPLIKRILEQRGVQILPRTQWMDPASSASTYGDIDLSSVDYGADDASFWDTRLGQVTCYAGYGVGAYVVYQGLRACLSMYQAKQR